MFKKNKIFEFLKCSEFLRKKKNEKKKRKRKTIKKTVK
jgi:hypothetical protein